jgi:hypothetical protein
MPDQQQADQAPVSADVSYESSDAQISPIACMGFGIVLLGLVAHIVCLWLFGVLKASEKRDDPGLAPLAAKERPQLIKDLGKIPPPRLQIDEAADMENFRKTEEGLLHSYGWTDPKSGKIRIPIAQAIRLLSDPEIAKTRGIRVEVAPRGGQQ